MYSFPKYSFPKSHVSSLCSVGGNYYYVLSFVFYWEYSKTITLHGSCILHYQHTRHTHILHILDILDILDILHILDILCTVRSTHKECAEYILSSHVWTTKYPGPIYIPDLVHTYTYCIAVRSALCC